MKSELSSPFVLAHFLHAKRGPLRVKMLQSIVRNPGAGFPPQTARFQKPKA
jgi:hypothetical protein